MRTKLNVLPVLHRNKIHKQVEETVKHKQQKSKEYTDTRAAANFAKFQVNDAVRVRRPEHVHKGSSRFTEPRTVVKKVGPSTYLLSDGRKSNASKLAHFPKQALACTSKDNEIVLDGLMVPENVVPNPPEPGPTRNIRVRNPPQCFCKVKPNRK